MAERDETSRRSPGGLRGKIEIAPDFDIVPGGLLAAMEGEAARSSCSTRVPCSGGWLAISGGSTPPSSTIKKHD